jgi:hypothetical protein
MKLLDTKATAVQYATVAAAACALAVAIYPRPTPRKAYQLCFFVSIESAEYPGYLDDLGVAGDRAASCEFRRLWDSFLLQDGMTPQRVSTVFLSLHLLTSKDL